MFRIDLIKRNYITAIFSLFMATIFAQDTIVIDKESEITASRPGQTEGCFTTSKGWLQAEIGFQNESYKDKLTGLKTQRLFCPTTLLKYGISEIFELRLIAEYINDKIKFTNADNNQDSIIKYRGLNPVSIGFKVALHKEKGMIPRIGFMSHVIFPNFSAEHYKTECVVTQCRFLFTNTLNKNVTLSYNLGVEWGDKSVDVMGTYTACLGIKLINNLSMFVESYNYIKKHSTPDQRIDYGFMYLITRDVQLDCSGGIGLGNKLFDYFISAGLAFRVNALKLYKT
jgi:hypothetical protein